MGDRAAPAGRWGILRYLRRFRGYGRPHIPALFAGVGMRVGELLADLAQPWPLAVVVDSVLGGKPLRGIVAGIAGPFAASRTSLLTAAVVASIALACISGLFDYLGDRIMNGAGERITAAIRGDLFAHLQRLPLTYHDGTSVGELVSRVSTDTSRIEDALVDLFSNLLPGILSIGGLFAMLLAVNWRLGLISLLSSPVLFITIARYTRLTRESARAVRAQEGILSGYVTETLTGIRTVAAAGNHDLHDTHFAAANRRTLAAGLRAIDLRARFTPLVQTSAALGSALLLWIGAWGVLHGAWSLGLLLVVLSYLRDMLKPIRSLSRLSITLSRGAASAERVAAVLDEPISHESRERGSAALPKRAAGGIELREVGFDYGRGEVLHNVSLTVRPGERVAILGANGSGKSSLLALVARLYDPTTGTILLDGNPLSRVPSSWLREQVAVVLQDTFLFSGTVWDNIAYGSPKATREQVLTAAKQSFVTEFVNDLPDRFETFLGERGVGLSGGQRQRIGIGRALLRDTPIVLLDEPISALDQETEQQIVAALQSLMRERTVLMATHRPALLALASRTITLENGLLTADEPIQPDNGAVNIRGQRGDGGRTALAPSRSE